MKNTILKRFVFVLVLAITYTSCQDSFLDESNPIALSSLTYFNTVTDLESGLIGVYNALKNENAISITSESHRSDLTYPGFGRPNPSNSGSIYWLQNFDASSQTTNEKWAALYTGIFRANQIIENAERLIPTFSESEQETAGVILAQARTLRGLFYFYLHNSYNNGSVPIFETIPSGESEFYQEAQPEEVVKQFYLADLEYGMNNLPSPGEYPDNEIGKVTSGAATALLGKSYLYEGDYVKAAEYFKSVMDDFSYNLTPDIGSNFTTRDEFNEESILEISYSIQFKPEESPASQQSVSTRLNYQFSPNGGWSTIYPACWLTVLYQNEQLDTKDPRNTIMKPVIINNGNTNIKGGTYERDVNDNIVMEEGLRDYSLRTSASIALVDDTVSEYYQAAPALSTNFGSGERHSWFRKYTNWDITTSEALVATSVQRSGVNVRLIRLADIYLMYAECLIKGGTDNGGLEEALTYINRVRRRSGIVLLGLPGTGEYPSNDHDNVSYTASSLMDHLMYVERPLELCVEGNAIRTIDLRRWGVTKQRFEDLATRRYYKGHYEFENANGGRSTRWGGRISDEVLFPQNANYVDPWPAWNEFEDAAMNYTEENNAYWPIPNNEEVTNPFIYDGN